MPRRQTSHLKVFSRPNVSYDLSIPNIVTITLPITSDWTSGLHWHESHTEYLQVHQGSILVTLNSTTYIRTSEDGIVTIPRFAKHEWRRSPDCDDIVIVREWTDPADGLKESFFRNLNSVLLEPGTSDWWVTLQLFVIFRGMDNWPVLREGVFEVYYTHVVLTVAAMIGWFLGVRSYYPEYTPAK